MEKETSVTPHWSFWAVGAFALIWNVLGSVNYVVQMNVDSLEAYREVEQAIIGGRPAWATAGFAIGVFGGSIGGLLLLLKKASASYVFMASLVGVIVTTAHTLGIDANFGFGEMLVIAVMPVVVAAVLLGYAKYAERRRWVI